MIEQRKLMHVQVSTGDEEAFIESIGKTITEGEKAYGVPLNLTKYVVSKRDIKLRETIRDADLVNADGVSIVWLARRHGFRDVFRVTGVELAERLIKESGERNWSIFILGAAPEIISKAVENLKSKYPQTGIAGFRDGYFKDDEIPAVIAAINRIQPDILLLGLGMPQKEYFIHDHLSNLDVHFCLPVGGAIDIWAGVKKRTPLWLQKIGMEWFYRSFYDFSRAWNIIKYGAVFLKDLVWIRR